MKVNRKKDYNKFFQPIIYYLKCHELKVYETFLHSSIFII